MSSVDYVCVYHFHRCLKLSFASNIIMKTYLYIGFRTMIKQKCEFNVGNESPLENKLTKKEILFKQVFNHKTSVSSKLWFQFSVS
jgi:hypothetical protein